jgi:hypothetical protein
MVIRSGCWQTPEALGASHKAEIEKVAANIKAE